MQHFVPDGMGSWTIARAASMCYEYLRGEVETADRVLLLSVTSRLAGKLRDIVQTCFLYCKIGECFTIVA